MTKKIKLEVTSQEPSEEKTLPTPAGSKMVSVGSFGKIQREIDDSDLKNPAVGRLLLSERDKLLYEKTQLENYRDQYYDAEKRAAVLETKVEKEKGFQVLYTFCLTVGGIIVGAVFSIQGNLPLSIALGLVGGIMIIVSIIIAFIKK